MIITRLVLTRGKRPGERFTREDFNYLRNPEGVDCRDLDEVLDRFCAANDLEKGALLHWKDLRPLA